MRLMSVLLGLALVLPLAGTTAGPAVAAGAAAGPVRTVTTVVGERRAEKVESALAVTLRTVGGEPVAGVSVLVERRVNGVWRPHARAVTDEGGAATASLTMSRRAANNVVRARYAGGDEVPEGPDAPGPETATYGASGSGPAQVALWRRADTLTLTGPSEVRDGKTATLRVRRRTGDGQVVPGWVRLERRTPGGWRTAGAVRLGPDGVGTIDVHPRRDVRYRASAVRFDWVRAAWSSTLVVRNLPPGDPVRLPAAAPRPRISLPAQPRVADGGAHPVITRVPGRVWGEMTGNTWHRGCPVGRAGLRLLRVTYWGYDGYRHRGEMVVAAWAARGAGGALREMYDRGFPVRSMYRVDRFGWSSALHGGNDYRSMSSGNTSGFNCRSVVNKPGVLSPHAYGGAIDVNTWENPYLSRTGWVPNRWWSHRSHARVAWRSSGHPVVQIWRRHGFRWSYGVGDSQHFDAIRGATGRTVTPRACVGAVSCH